ncbi:MULTISPECIES: FAD-binding oxidoreductase [unclassified Leucobacter]|uniref:NAD(P)/FAD-dependent oxidoreductase n=1 Tax=unclassified Leucobacter TaxID=2621730 RepID=UPI00165D4DE6|nr:MULTISPECIES: FAD-binding oxidoreductase [unclassified Leucobacter]MBC9927891.1 FAD-dependent oxidoreductase [Leucobacter sp. cx-169]MBC9937591.1 FAD-dependent oxidoreductase [Leucobacter sp. cx-87]
MINGNVSHWWQDIGAPQSRPALPGDLTADVAIVGAGYTGLWTAYYLKQAKPELRVVIIEQRHVGYGASGRNGGWLTNAITGGREQYVKSHGRDAAERFQRAMNDTVDEVIRVAAAEGIDADIKKGGEFNVAYTPAQEARIRGFAAAEQAWKSTDLQLLEASEAKAKINVANTRAAVWHPHSARIQPAKLAKGLADTVERMGVEIYENTRAEEITPHRVRTTHGTVSADYIVRATEGFTAGLKGLKRLWLPMNSSLIATEPLAQSVWDELNWSQGEVLGDFAHVYMYAQRTADDRIAIGGRGVPYKFGSKTDLDGNTPEETAKTLSEILHRFFPATQGAAIDHVWSGVLGVPRDWAATVGLDRETGIAWGGGYVGTGVTTTNLSGRTITDLILGNKTELTTLPWVNHKVRKWEPEPLRWLATKGLYAAYGMADRAELNGRETTSPIAHIADVVTGRG